MVAKISLWRLFRIPPGEWLLAGQAWGLLLLVDLGLRLLPYPRLLALLYRSSGGRSQAAPGVATAQIARTHTAVERARHCHLYPMTCLRRSLAWQWLLARRGVTAELKLGARKENGQLQAHAWLEYQGRPLAEPEQVETRFARLAKAGKP